MAKLTNKEQIIDTAVYFENEIEPFAVVKRDVIFDQKLDNITKLVFTHFTMLMNEQSMFQVRDDYIKGNLGITQQEFQNAVKELEENRYIKTVTLDNGSLGYGIIRKYLIVKGVMR